MDDNSTLLNVRAQCWRGYAKLAPTPEEAARCSQMAEQYERLAREALGAQEGPSPTGI